MINVTKTFLPDFDEYVSILKRAWDMEWITNNGMLVQELELHLKTYLNTEHLYYTSNGTVVLQMALKALGVKRQVITTPFSYVATTNAILWEGCTPVFVDINSDTFCIDANKIEEAITVESEAILATHVYGLPCEIEKIEAIARKHKLKVIYDGAHAFGCSYNGQSLLNYGDISTCSFHATKLFHTVEGGCIICQDEETSRQVYLFRQFGHVVDDYHTIGINAKNSEFHAAMGLAILPKLEEIIQARKVIFETYNALLEGVVSIPNYSIENFEYNYAYYPVVFNSEGDLLKVRKLLQDNEINTRRYFYPSLNTLPYLESKQACPVSEDMSRRVLCLPLYYGLSTEDISRIAGLIVQCLHKTLVVQK